MRLRDRFSFMPCGLLLLLMLIGSYLRLHNLDFQSLWYDELVTMTVSNPANSIRNLFGFLKRGFDANPPLYPVVAHAWFKIIGYDDYSGRLLSAIAGILTIPAMYFLTKELYSRSAGLIAATFTTFNYFNIYYSQETRSYALVFLFASLSFAFLARALRNPTWKSGLYYALVTTLLIYTHYYGLVILFAQALIALVFLIAGSSQKSTFLFIGGAFLLVILLYSPWIGITLALDARHKSFWIPPPTSGFFVEYFKDYFGEDIISTYLFAFLMIAFLAGGILERTRNQAKENGLYDRYIFSFVILTTWISVSFLVPYIKSLVSVPMLWSRYTMVTLPAILSAVAIGLEMFSRVFIRVYFVIAAVILSLVHLFFFTQYYKTPIKEQRREMTQFVIANSSEQVPIITDYKSIVPYYFRFSKVSPMLFRPKNIPELANFWVMTSDKKPQLSEEEQKVVDRDFKLEKSFKGHKVWAKLFSRRWLTLTFRGGRNDSKMLKAGEKIHTYPVDLLPGDYHLILNGSGNNSRGGSSKVQLALNGNLLADFNLGALEDYSFPFRLEERSKVEFSIGILPGQGEQKISIEYISIDPSRKIINQLIRMNQKK